MNKKIVIIGANSAMAEHCIRLWVTESPKNLVLLSRDIVKNERVIQDIKVRSPLSTIAAYTIDFVDPLSIQSWTDQIVAEGMPDIVLIAHGYLPDQLACQLDISKCHDALNVNGISPVLFAEAFASHMQKTNAGTIAIIGSVAGDRGRKSNYVYGAAKGLVTRYTQGLQHRLAGTNVKVVLIKPGPTNTPMTAQLRNAGAKFANVDDVAKTIVEGIDCGKSIIYAPVKWKLIMMIIRHLPSFVFNRMDI